MGANIRLAFHGSGVNDGYWIQRVLDKKRILNFRNGCSTGCKRTFIGFEKRVIIFLKRYWTLKTITM
ncbi:MAG: hypothetical protein KGO81_11395 [Bacteroidota bacterium]|nr:hypothetical protein [Bacteroidota bacterium]